MYKKSSSNSGGSKRSGSSFKKDDSRGGSSDRKPYKRNDDMKDERPRKPFRESDGDAPRKSFRKDDSAGEKRPYKKRDDAGGDAPRRSFHPGDADSRGGFKRDDARGAERKPYKKFDGPRDRDEKSDRLYRKPAPRRDDDAGGDAPRKSFRSGDTGSRGGFRKDDSRGGDSAGKRPYKKPDTRRDDNGGADAPRRSFRSGDADSRGGFKRDDSRGDDRKPFTPRSRDEKTDRPYKAFRAEGGKEGDYKKKEGYAKPDRDNDRPRKEFTRPGGSDDRKAKPFGGIPEKRKTRESFKKATYVDDAPPRKSYVKRETSPEEAEYYGDDAEWEIPNPKKPKRQVAATYPMPLNKFIAHSGECSRRDAAELVKQGKAKVNGELIIDPGYKVNEGDQITLSGKKLTPQKGLVYILLNKPKGFITTNEDEKGRKTVMDLIHSSDVGRVFSVGRLDRATTGLLLLTNDGDLTQKLSHPSYDVKKVYHVTLDKPLTQADFEKIMAGIELEDGKTQVDEMAYLEKKNELGVEIHSGKNRIVRRIFESLGYVVDKLDRMMYAGLTKKNLPRGKWRFLDEREVVLLKHFKS